MGSVLISLATTGNSKNTFARKKKMLRGFCFLPSEKESLVRGTTICFPVPGNTAYHCTVIYFAYLPLVHVPAS